jgi:hypothetical protein
MSSLSGFLMSAIVLDINSLTCRFGAFTAVNGLTLSVPGSVWRSSSTITHQALFKAMMRTFDQNSERYWTAAGKVFDYKQSG